VLPDFLQLSKLTNDELGAYDIAAVNLACSVGLPGAEGIDVPGCFSKLDEWADGVRDITNNLIETQFAKKAHLYGGSLPLYRVVKMVQTLKTVFKVRYDPTKVNATPDDPFDFHEHFLHGPIQGPGGTCFTFPILYAAVGRRLGYPIRLAYNREHVFNRWDDPTTGTRFNFDGTGPDVSSQPDDHYRQWPEPLTPEVEEKGGFLRTQTPRGELSMFVSRRAAHWETVGNYRRAASAHVLAFELWSYRPQVAAIQVLAERWQAKLQTRKPSSFPSLRLKFDPGHPRWPRIPWDFEQQLRYLESLENVLNDREFEVNWCAPLRAGQPPRTPVPNPIHIDCTGDSQCSIRP